MSVLEITIAVALAVLIIAVVAAVLLWWRHHSLKSRFGPEYDRAVTEHDSKLAADRELRARERQHAKLELRPLDDATRSRYAAAWQQIQAEFVESPEAAIGDAEELMTQLVAERGYPTDDRDQQLEQLSVDHARTLSAYREAHATYERHQRGEATTEDLRQALVYYRTLFSDLLDEADGGRGDHGDRGGQRGNGRRAGAGRVGPHDRVRR